MRRRTLPKIEIKFIFEGERWIGRLGDTDAGETIELFMDADHPQKSAATIASQLAQHGLSIKTMRTMRSAVFGGPLAILLDRVIAALPQQNRTA